MLDGEIFAEYARNAFIVSYKKSDRTVIYRYLEKAGSNNSLLEQLEIHLGEKILLMEKDRGKEGFLRHCPLSPQIKIEGSVLAIVIQIKPLNDIFNKYYRELNIAYYRQNWLKEKDSKKEISIQPKTANDFPPPDSIDALLEQCLK